MRCEASNTGGSGGWLRLTTTPPQAAVQLPAAALDQHLCRPRSQAEVEAWLKRHPRFHIHLIPASSSWLNLVERWFRQITDKRIRRGVFHSVGQPSEAIMDYIARHNDNPKPFVWTAKAARAWDALNVATE